MSKDITKLIIKHDKALLELSWTIIALNCAIQGIEIPSPKPREKK